MRVFENTVLPAAAAVVIILVILTFARSKKSKKEPHYDEMQIRIRATGYKIGFFVTLIGVFLLAFLTEMSDAFSRAVPPVFGMAAVGFAGIVVFAVYCIFKDAFYSIGQNRKSYVILCAVIVVMNGAGIVPQIRSRSLFLADYMNLLCFVCFAVILIALLVKGVIDRREEVAE